MVQTTDMASERTNQFKIMLSDAEREWLEELAGSRGLTSSDVIRQYIREARAQLHERKGLLESKEDDFRWKDWHTEILRRLAVEKDPILREDLFNDWQGAPFPPNGARALNELNRNDYLRRYRSGYVITPKGKAVVA
jgi:hypothetical protein